jgi:hypothetical protein
MAQECSARTRDAHSASSDGHHGTLLEIATVAGQHLADDVDPARRGHVGQPDDSAMRLAVPEDKLAEVGVDGDQNAALRDRASENLPVSGIGTQLTGFAIVPVAQPVQTPAGAAVDQELTLRASGPDRVQRVTR